MIKIGINMSQGETIVHGNLSNGQTLSLPTSIITNTGNVTEQITISTTNDLQADQTQFTLNPDQSTAINLLINVPYNNQATGQEIGYVIATASSTATSKVTAGVRAKYIFTIQSTSEIAKINNFVSNNYYSLLATVMIISLIAIGISKILKRGNK